LIVWGLSDLHNPLGNTIGDIGFIILGILLFTPGVYYAYKILSIYRAHTYEERMAILNEFPIEI